MKFASVPICAPLNFFAANFLAAIVFASCSSTPPPRVEIPELPPESPQRAVLNSPPKPIEIKPTRLQKKSPRSKKQTATQAIYLSGDEAFKKRATASEGWRALKIYREIFAKNPSDPEAAWRVAMACYFVGIRLVQDSDKKISIYAEGKDAGLTGVKLNPKCTACHFWTAINMALYGETVGVFKMLFSLKEVEAHLQKSIDLDPTYAYGGAFRLLGMIEWKLPGVLGGNDDEAKAFFEKAIAIAPDEPLHYFMLAQLLEDEFKDRTRAVAIAKRGLSVPELPEDRLESRDALQDLQQFVESHPLK